MYCVCRYDVHIDEVVDVSIMCGPNARVVLFCVCVSLFLSCCVLCVYALCVLSVSLYLKCVCCFQVCVMGFPFTHVVYLFVDNAPRLSCVAVSFCFVSVCGSPGLCHVFCLYLACL